MSFFVPSLDNAVDNDDYLRRWKARTTSWENICEKQFQLVYFGKFDYESIEKMSVHERDFFYGKLVKQKQSERDQYESSLSSNK